MAEPGQVANFVLGAAQQAEGVFTPMLSEIAGQVGVERVGQTTVFKDPISILRKLHRSMADKGSTALQAAQDIWDGCRYALVLDPVRADGTATRAQQVADLLEAKGCLVDVENRFQNGSRHKAVVLRVQTRTGERCSVHLHTRDSWRAYRATHAAYKRMLDASLTPQERFQAYEENMREWVKVPIPPGLAEIGTPTRVAAPSALTQTMPDRVVSLQEELGIR